MARGEPERRAGAAEHSDPVRSYIGRVRISGSWSSGLSIAFASAAAENLDVEPGDQLEVEHDPRRDEIILSSVDE